MDFHVDFLYDNTSADLEGKKAILSNSLSELESVVYAFDTSRCVTFKQHSTGLPFEDVTGEFYRYAYYDPAFEPDEPEADTASRKIFTELTKLSVKDSVDAMRDALNKIPGYIVRNLIHELLGWDCVLEELIDSGFVSSCDTDAIVNVVNNDDEMSEAVFQYYKDNRLSNEDKAELIKDWISELL